MCLGVDMLDVAIPRPESNTKSVPFMAPPPIGPKNVRAGKKKESVRALINAANVATAT